MKHQKSKIFERARNEVPTCPSCKKGKVEIVHVKVEGARQKVKSFQCPACDYFSFEEESSKKVLQELDATPLKISQKIVKLSHNRLGIYLNKDIIKSLNLKSGKEIKVSVPDKKHIVLIL